MYKYLVLICGFILAACGGGENSIVQIAKLTDFYDAFIGIGMFIIF